MNSFFKLNCAVAVAFGLLPAAHALSDSPMTMQYESVDDVATQRSLPNSQERPATAPGARGACTLSLTKVEDLRVNKETLGGPLFMLQTFNAVPLGGASIVSGDGGKWMQGAIASLGKSGIQVVPGDAAAAAKGELGLRLAHAWSAGYNLNAHVVLMGSFVTSAGSVTKRYHGFGTKLNMINGDGEFMQVLNMAMTDALKAYAEDAQTACAGKPIPGAA